MSGLRLNLACGSRPRDGYTGVDVSADCDAEVVCDLRDFPWPWPDSSVAAVYCNHFFEHLTGPERIGFMAELWRVLEVGGTATIITPYHASWRAVADPTHVFPPIVEQSYLYFNRAWREREKLSHYPIKCNFDFECRFVFNPEVAFPSDGAQAQGIKHYWNVVDDLETVLEKLP